MRTYKINPGTAIRCRRDITVKHMSDGWEFVTLSKGTEGTVLETFRNQYYHDMPTGTNIVLRVPGDKREFWFNTMDSRIASSDAFRVIPLRPELVVPHVEINRTVETYVTTKELPLVRDWEHLGTVPAGTVARISGLIDREAGTARLEFNSLPSEILDRIPPEKRYAARYTDPYPLELLSQSLRPR